MIREDRIMIREYSADFDKNNLHALINNTDDLMWSVDRNYKLITSNKAFDSMVMQMTGKSISKGSDVLADGFTGQQIVYYKTLYDRAFAGESFKIVEHTDIPVLFWSELSFYPIFHNDNIVGTACFSHDITNRKVLEKRIETERERFADLFSMAPSSICILMGPTHVYEMVNQQYLEFTGKNDILGKTVAEVFPEAEQQGFIKLLDDVYKTGNAFTDNEALVQINNYESEGSRDQYINFVYQPYKNSKGEITGIFFFANVVTEQVLARKTIEKNEKYFRSLVENAGDLITLTDKHGNLKYVSPALEKLTGCTAKKVMGKSLFSFQHPDSLSDSKQKFNELLRNPGVPVHRISRILCKDGSYMWVEGTVINLLDDENVQGIVGNFHDVSERKFFEEKLIVANRLYDLIGQINQAISHIDDENKFLIKACAIAIDNGKFDLAFISFPDQATRKNNIVAKCNATPRDLEFFNNKTYDDDGPMGTVLKRGKVYIIKNYDAVFLTGQSREYAKERGFKSCILLPLKKGGKTIGVLSMFSASVNLFDLQELHLLEEASGDISFALDLFEKERDKKQIEIDRKKITDDLVQRNKDLEQFSQIISHNLRGPVTNIMGLTSILQTVGLDKEEEKVAAGYLATAAKNLDNVIHDLNEILKVKHDLSEIKEVVDLSELLNDIQASIENQIKNNKVTVIIDFSATNEIVTIKSYLYSIIFNLLSNSIKYRQPEKSLLIKVSSSISNGDTEIICSDNGRGIDLEKNGANIFGLYKRFHHDIEGKGIGLYMVKAQVESLGGDISVTSDLNKGTEFRIKFKNERARHIH